MTCGGGTDRDRMCMVPMVVGYMPVMIAERLGAQTPETEKQRV